MTLTLTKLVRGEDHFMLVTIMQAGERLEIEMTMGQWSDFIAHSKMTLKMK